MWLEMKIKKTGLIVEVIRFYDNKEDREKIQKLQEEDPDHKLFTYEMNNPQNTFHLEVKKLEFIEKHLKKVKATGKKAILKMNEDPTRLTKKIKRYKQKRPYQRHWTYNDENKEFPYEVRELKFIKSKK